MSDPKRSELMRARWEKIRHERADHGEEPLDTLDLAALIDSDVRSDDDDVRDVVAGRIGALDPRRL